MALILETIAAIRERDWPNSFQIDAALATTPYSLPSPPNPAIERMLADLRRINRRSLPAWLWK